MGWFRQAAPEAVALREVARDLRRRDISVQRAAIDVALALKDASYLRDSSKEGVAEAVMIAWGAFDDKNATVRRDSADAACASMVRRLAECGMLTERAKGLLEAS